MRCADFGPTPGSTRSASTSADKAEGCLMRVMGADAGFLSEITERTAATAEVGGGVCRGLFFVFAMSTRERQLQRGCKQCARCTHGEPTSCDAKRAAYRRKDQRRGALRHRREPCCVAARAGLHRRAPRTTSERQLETR